MVADYVLTYRGQKLAVIEAKKRGALRQRRGLGRRKPTPRSRTCASRFPPTAFGIYRR